MKKFIGKILCFLIIFAVLFSALMAFDIFVVKGQFQNYYQASVTDKVNRLNSIDEPKIILVGNSNLAFGIDSAMLEDEFDMPVVNMGLHGGIGNAFNEQIAKAGIKKGDIVVVAHTYYSDLDAIEDREAAWIAIDNNVSLLSLLRTKDYIPMMKAYPSYLQNSLIMWATHTGNEAKDSSYSRKAFNEYGDIVYRPDSEQVDVDSFFESEYIHVPYINDICTDRLNELYEYCNAKGATMVIAGYPIAYGKYSIYNEIDFVDFQKELDDMVEAPIISDFTDYMYPYEYFYNSALHMTAEGAKVRTNQLISDLHKMEIK